MVWRHLPLRLVPCQGRHGDPGATTVSGTSRRRAPPAGHECNTDRNQGIRNAHDGPALVSGASRSQPSMPSPASIPTDASMAPRPQGTTVSHSTAAGKLATRSHRVVARNPDPCLARTTASAATGDGPTLSSRSHRGVIREALRVVPRRGRGVELGTCLLYHESLGAAPTRDARAAPGARHVPQQSRGRSAGHVPDPVGPQARGGIVASSP